MPKVLIVEDEQGIREMLSLWMVREGYDVREAPDAETALEMMTLDASDVVLCDVEMPGPPAATDAAESIEAWLRPKLNLK